MALEKELETYQANLQALLAQQGKFVVIFGAEMIGFFDTYADAIQAGYEKCGLDAFLVKRVQEVEELQFTSSMFGACYG